MKHETRIWFLDENYASSQHALIVFGLEVGMSKQQSKKSGQSEKHRARANRQKRLAKALRANLGRRKEQDRVRQQAVGADLTQRN